MLVGMRGWAGQEVVEQIKTEKRGEAKNRKKEERRGGEVKAIKIYIESNKDVF
jgi:hypothetical protein